MYPPMEMDNGTYYPKPMNCPMHCLIYRSRQRSYRELPLRLFELGTVYRYERAGTLHGLMRVRGFTQDDSHIFCTPEQVARRDRLAARLRAVGAAGVRLRRLHVQPVDEGSATSSSARDEVWEQATEALRERARAPRARVHGEGGRRRVLRAEDRHRCARRDRARRGSCRRSSTTSTTPSGSTSSTSAPTTPGTARSCCTAPCSGRSSASSACCSSTTPAPSRRGWRRCRSRVLPVADRPRGVRREVVDAHPSGRRPRRRRRR